MLPEKGLYIGPDGQEWELYDYARSMADGAAVALLRRPGNDRDIFVKPVSQWTGDPALRPAFTAEAPADPMPAEKLAVLKRYYGYDSFREGQEEVVDAILSGRDTLAVMPTGAGKSLCYQVPALLLDGVTLVVSPLISLMKDQVQALVQNGIPAAYLNSSLTDRQFTLALRNMCMGKYRIVYVAPERLCTPRFLAAVQSTRIAMLAVDEAHCISQWGQDFRPSYLEIPALLKELSYRPIMCAFTATATEKVREDILRLLELKAPFVRITGFDRKNLYYQVLRPKKKDDELLRLLEHYRGFAGIVYCATRKKVEEVHSLLRSKGYDATRYHAGLSDEERRLNQEDFSYDRCDIMVATNAFGMGIDKSNVRFIIHYNMPKDPESYYQEAGRAGRDGDRADCTLLFGRQDIITQRFFIDRMGEDNPMPPEELEKVQKNARDRLKLMVRYCETPGCLRRYMLSYFGEQGPDNCGFCLNCLQPAEQLDVTTQAIRLLECIEQTGERFGRSTIADVVLGSESRTVLSFRLTRALTYGSLHGMSHDAVMEILDRLLELDAIESVEQGGDRRFPILHLGPEARSVLDGAQSVTVLKRATPAKKTKKAKTEPEPFFDVDRDLYECLKAYRMKLARSRGVPPFVIFPDTVLRELSGRKPRTMEELEKVKGIGVVKLRDYGRGFLTEIERYLEEKQQ